MKPVFLFAFPALLLFACSDEPSPQAPDTPETPTPSGPPAPQAAAPAPAPSAPAAPEPAWESLAGTEGLSLRLRGADGATLLDIACRSGPSRLSVNAPAFTPVMSEDRFALGLGDEPVTLVADPYRQPAGKGVTGEGPGPGNLVELLERADAIRALYGAQQSGPWPAPPPALKKALAEACSD